MLLFLLMLNLLIWMNWVGFGRGILICQTLFNFCNHFTHFFSSFSFFSFEISYILLEYWPNKHAHFSFPLQFKMEIVKYEICFSLLKWNSLLSSFLNLYMHFYIFFFGKQVTFPFNQIGITNRLDTFDLAPAHIRSIF